MRISHASKMAIWKQCGCSPFAYALRAVVVNEMTSKQWSAPHNVTNPADMRSVGQASLESFGFFTDRCSHLTASAVP